MSEANKWKSRKFVATMALLSIFIVMFAAPPAISFYMGKEEFRILQEGGFVTLVLGLISAYMTANSFIHKVESSKNGLTMGREVKKSPARRRKTTKK